MANYLEHVNLTVANIDETMRFITTAFPEFTLRGEGTQEGNRWAHVGTESSYIALNESPKERESPGPLNHLGFVVDDLSAVAQRLNGAGYEEGFQAPEHPHRTRRYFFDPDGIEWEFVEYHSADPAERNDYSE